MAVRRGETTLLTHRENPIKHDRQDSRNYRMTIKIAHIHVHVIYMYKLYMCMYTVYMYMHIVDCTCKIKWHKNFMLLLSQFFFLWTTSWKLLNNWLPTMIEECWLDADNFSRPIPIKEHPARDRTDRYDTEKGVVNEWGNTWNNLTMWTITHIRVRGRGSRPTRCNLRENISGCGL